MPNFIGFSTIDKNKKFTMVDRDLIKRDLLNALLIRAGTLPGKPEVGTKIWDYIFDPADSVTTGNIDTEMRRVIGLDKRIQLNDLVIRTSENTVLVQASVSLLPDYSVEDFYITFSRDDETATIA